METKTETKIRRMFADETAVGCVESDKEKEKVRSLLDAWTPYLNSKFGESDKEKEKVRSLLDAWTPYLNRGGEK